MQKGKAGPRYPSVLSTELKARPSNGQSEVDEEQKPEIQLGDVYEFEEGVPEEESGKNRQFDDVDRLEYELPSVEDEEIPEDTDEEGEDEPISKRKAGQFGMDVDREDDENEEGYEESDEDADNEENSDEMEEDGLGGAAMDAEDEDSIDDGGDDENDADDEERHLKMISDVTGNASSYLLAGQKKRKRQPEITEAYEESEYNVNPAAVPGSRPITVEDLMSTLRDKPRFGALRKRMEELEKRFIPLQPPCGNLSRIELRGTLVMRRQRRHYKVAVSCESKSGVSMSRFYQETRDTCSINSFPRGEV